MTAELQLDSPEVDGEQRTLLVPLLPLAENVIFPQSIYPLSLVGEQAHSVVASAKAAEGLVALFLQKGALSVTSTVNDLFRIGTLARLNDVLELEDRTLQVTAEGLVTVKLLNIVSHEPYALAQVEVVQESKTNEVSPDMAEVRGLYTRLLSYDPAAAARLLPVLENTIDPLQVVYLVAATIPISPLARQSILEASDLQATLQQIKLYVTKALEVASQNSPNGNISQTVGSASAASSAELAANDRAEIERAIREAGLPPHILSEVERELDRLGLLTTTSPDYSLVRNYLQWLADLPWHTSAEPEVDLEAARAILDHDHYGLAEVKARIIEHLAVHKLRQERLNDSDQQADAGGKQPVLCLAGPPGVGKTSLGRSIAEALGRPFVRVSLGGITDEAEIRGHRRTYLGAMPGRVIQSLVRAASNGPVMMLDELDKIGSREKGDPSAALLDVLDPEQQHEFSDHYIEVPFDISNIFFLATANTLETVPEALRDRLEIIRLSGYTEEEKVQIAVRHLIPRQMEWHALNAGDLVWDEDGVLEILRSYTREAGVRQLDREIAGVCRRIAAMIAETGTQQVAHKADAELISQVLGTPRFLSEEPVSTDQPGVVTGLFWTPVGGDIMHIEALTMAGSKSITITGHMGDVMRESAQTALSYVRAHAEELDIDPNFYEYSDLHLHIPSGAVAKDGPSAGVALAAALVSALTKTAVSGDLAMTGEMTLTGRVLPVGGVKEKVLAARRAGIHNVILPSQNRRDLDEVQPEALSDMNIIFVDSFDEVLKAAFPGDAPPRIAKFATSVPS